MKKLSNKIESITEELMSSGIKSRNDLDSFKRKMAKKYKIACLTNVELLKTYHKLVKKKSINRSDIIENLLRTRPIRSLSGIINVSILTKPYPCPGKCIYCPTERGIPKSYLKEEPAVQRAVLCKFDPRLQVQTRLKSLKKTGHPLDKIELRIIGGTWSYYPKNYQTWFIKECFRAANEFFKSVPIGSRLKTLEEIQRRNEKAKCRIIGITIETRPDYINEKEIKRMRELGITRVELGVQTIYNDILKLVKRGHLVKATKDSTRFLKDAGFKICYQIMPNLPGSNFKKDLKMFEEIFKNPDFKPDLLKIYPLALVKSSILYKWHLQGKYKPHSKQELVKLLVEIKKIIPYWIRIQRIVRDIPSKDIIEGGAKISNLREIVQKEMQEKGLKCRCIRCREVKENYNPKEKLYLLREDYKASAGKEIFLSFEDKIRRKLYALLRLRIPSQYYENRSRNIIPVLKEAAIIREVHTYGQMTPVGEKGLQPQHRGLGKKLIKEAEKIVKKEFGLKKIAIISGVGVRSYYRQKLAYRLKDTYMIKKI